MGGGEFGNRRGDLGDAISRVLKLSCESLSAHPLLVRAGTVVSWAALRCRNCGIVPDYGTPSDLDGLGT